MASIERRRDLGIRQGRTITRKLGEEIRTARIAAGLSQSELGHAVGISGAHVGRLERSVVEGASVSQYAVLFALLGMRLSARPYPEGPPIRDVAHARLLARFRAQLPPGVMFRTEVPVALEGDLRAWDAEVRVQGESCKIEAETALYDLQATDRRVALKMADDAVSVVILLVAATRRNRRVLAEFRTLVEERYPLDTRQVMAALRSGTIPQQSGIVVM